MTKMPLLLRGVDPVEVRHKLATGVWTGEVLGFVQRFHEAPTPLKGEITEIITPSQEKIRLLTVPLSRVCMWCRREVIPKHNIGIPFRLAYEAETKTYTVFTHDSTCCFECSAAVIQQQEQAPFIKRNSLDHNSWEILYALYSKQFPNKILRPAPDPVLLQSNTAPVLRHYGSCFVPQNGFRHTKVQRVFNATTKAKCGGV